MNSPDLRLISPTRLPARIMRSIKYWEGRCLGGRLATLLVVWLMGAAIAHAATITGLVQDSETGRPLPDAIVMVQGTQISTHSDVDGKFSLESGDADLATRQITAWRDGYSIAGGMAATGQALNLALEPLPADDPTYEYQSAQTCGACHTDIYRQWQNTSMGRATGEKLPQKLHFYLGTNEDGKFDGLGFGWKFFAPMMSISQGVHAMNLDHYVGTCVNCHARGATWKEGVFEPHRKLNPATGEVFTSGSLKVLRFDKLDELPVSSGSEGITCDVCHSVQDVRIHHDQFGNLETVKIDKMEVVRRGEVKFGPFRDAVSPAHKTAYSPIFTKSEFCAMCHMERADDLEAAGVQALLTLDEYPRWKSHFDAGTTDKQCQSCHMYTGGREEWSMRKAAIVGVDREPDTLYGHHWRGSYFDGEMARRASNLKLRAQRREGELIVSAEVANVGAAHKMPGGPPFRQMLLLIEATDSNGNALEPLDPVRADPIDAANANRIIDVGGGYRKYGFFKLWELQFGRPFPQMPYKDRIGKVYNASWVTPAFFPMEWMFRYFWVGVIPLLIGIVGWSPVRAMFGGSPKVDRPGFFSANVGTLDRVLRIVGGGAVLAWVPMPWGLVGLVPLFSGLVGWCPTYRLIGGVDTCETGGFFQRNVGLLDRVLRIVAGGVMLYALPTPWNWIGLVPLSSGVLGWCPTYRLIGNISTRSAKPLGLFNANVGTGDRLLRAAIGLGLLSLLFWGPQTAWGALGLIPLFTAIMGNCIPYRIAGIDTRGDEERQRKGWSWSNLDAGERRAHALLGFALIAMAAVLPKVAAMHMWPVGGFAAERVLYDTRIDYREADTTHYRFAAPTAGVAVVKAQLVYLRHWYFMEAIKGEAFWGTDKWKYLLHELEVEVAGEDGAVAAADAGNREGSLIDMPQIPSTPGAGAWRQQAEQERSGRGDSSAGQVSTDDSRLGVPGAATTTSIDRTDRSSATGN
ncbi:MAG: YgaP-like transmembrane domain [Gammaproteobacteria bacterium]